MSLLWISLQCPVQLLSSGTKIKYTGTATSIATLLYKIKMPVCLLKLQKCHLHQMMCTEGQQIYIQYKLLLTLKQKICYLLMETVSSSKSSWIESNKVCLQILFIIFFSDYGALTMICPVVGVKVMSCYPGCLILSYSTSRLIS